MDGSILGLASILIGVLGAATALSMVFLVLWQAPTNRDNQLLAAYMGSVVVWGTAITLFRLSGGLQIFFSIASYSAYANGFLLFVLVSHTLNLWSQWWVRAVLILGTIVVAVFAPLSLLFGRVYTDLAITEAGSRYDLQRAGWVGIAGTLTYFLASAALIWHHRHQKGRSLFPGTLVAPIGLLALAVPVLNQLHMPMVFAVISSVLFTRAILREKLFNPMVELNRVLTASESHYRALAEELSRKEKLYHTLARNLPGTGIVLFDEKLHILVVEGQLHGLAEMLFKGQRVENAKLPDALPSEIYQLLAPHLQKVFTGIEGGFFRSFEGRDYQVHIVPVRDERGTPFAGMIVTQDVTEMKQAERQAMELTLEKERVRILRQFVSDATHDLMTPLTGIKMSIHLLKRHLSDEAAEPRVRDLEGHVSRLITLVTDMLDIARLDEETVLRMAGYDLNALVQDVVDTHGPAASARAQTLENQLTELPSIPMDVEKLERALSNVVMNAIAYTPNGGRITVSTALRDDQAVMEVRDTGIGIAPEELSHIFERFYRVDRARSSQSGGTGLGLAITKRIVDLHGGSIEVESEPGQGSVFRILLPCQIAIDNPSPTQSRKPSLS